MKQSIGLIALILFVAGITLMLSYQVNVHNAEFPNGAVRGQIGK